MQSRQNKKIYSIDKGLCKGISFQFSNDEGKLAENLVFVELMRSGLTPYYRKRTREVDFVMKLQDNTLSAINVCYSDEIPDRESEDLKEFEQEFDGKVNRLLILTKDYEAQEGKITCIPLWNGFWRKKENR